MMSRKVKDFVKKYLEKLKNDKDIRDNKIEEPYLFDFRDVIKFHVAYRSRFPAETSMEMISIPTINLDDEDLEYLYNKYSKRLKKELEDNIEAINNEYEQLD